MRGKLSVPTQLHNKIDPDKYETQVNAERIYFGRTRNSYHGTLRRSRTKRDAKHILKNLDIHDDNPGQVTIDGMQRLERRKT